MIQGRCQRELNLGDTAELSTDVGVIDRRVSTAHRQNTSAHFKSQNC
jgi:hypothetical protein